MRVLVLQASGLHVGFLGCYGNTWINTPILDRLAAESVVFDQHYMGNWPGARLLTTENRQLVTHHISGQDLPASSDGTPLERTLDAAADALETLAGKPRWLCWVDLPSLHPPWDVARHFTLPYLEGESGDDEDEPFEPLLNPPVGVFDRDDLELWERLRCTYAGAVTYLDAGLGLLFDELKNRRLFEDVTLIFTADRGLALGDHGIVGDCQPWLHEEVVHLPLIVRMPAAAHAGLRVAALTQPGDLAATLHELFGVPKLPVDGHSLLPLIRGEVEAVREHAVSSWKLGDNEEWALRTLKNALLVPIEQQQRLIQLYLKPEDRWEHNNVIQHHLELADEQEKILRECCRRNQSHETE
jgi:arylsulfatase A-like enzyme